MSKILGLDLGTNSIGWAVVNAEKVERDDKSVYLKPVSIDMAGSRIIPMDASIQGNFEAGNSVSQTADRTTFRGVRRLRERFLLRRERLNRVLDIMGFLPEHYSMELDRYGKFKTTEKEPKLAWKPAENGKYEFIFMDSFNEMLEDFKQYHPDLLKEGKKLPLDWTLYYLRKKALTQQISNNELAWILLNFNQKRGYYQLRGEEEEEKQNQLVEYYSLNVVKVEDSGEKKGDDAWYNVYLENGWIYRRQSKYSLEDWVGKKKDFIVTTTLDNDGNPKKDKDGNVKRSFRAPKEEDWTLQKKKTENDISQSGFFVGEYIYNVLLADPTQKINGQLVQTIDRKFYKMELQQILETQIKFNATLQNSELLNRCILELYPNNESHRNLFSGKNFTHLFVNDIIFYQRPLKSKKSLISNCPYEYVVFKDPKTEEYKRTPLKCISKSHPLFQEFRIWQFISNLRIYERSKSVNGWLYTDYDVTSEFLRSEEDYVALFKFLNDRSTISQDDLFSKHFNIKKPKGKDSVFPYRWNYVEDKEYPCNETRSSMCAALKKSEISVEKLTKDMELALWHILYSVNDKFELEKALLKFAKNNHLDESVVAFLSKMKPYDGDYGSYSEKAIKKLLPLMRMGNMWKYENIDETTRNRIEKIICGEVDESIKERVYKHTIQLREESDFKGLPVWLACYIVYNRHSETSDVKKWESPADIDSFLNDFKQHSLRNPIVEKIVLETLRTVRDIWKEVGTIDEIHVEMGREMKNPADVRAMLTKQNTANEVANMRIKTLLAEFVNPDYHIDGVRPYSYAQHEILRIYEDYALSNLKQEDAEYDFVRKISNTAQPSHNDVIRYKLWLEQKYVSPYTGSVIPLSKLFTSAYEIEHVIPQSRYFDDSFTNKVICESEVNKLKDKQLGYEFIKNHAGQKVQISMLNKFVEILSVNAYEEFVKLHYTGMKLKKLLMDDIPDQFIERQMNDSRYISKYIKGLLSNIVREKLADGEYEQEAISKNVIPSNGKITDGLKKDWGMHDVWNSIILPRFQRMNEITGCSHFTSLNREGHEIPAMPLQLSKGYNPKRIDHRHHAMDAIVIACTTRDHINLMNNEAALKRNEINRYQLSRKLRNYEFVEVVRDGKKKTIEVAKEFKLPWPSFANDARYALNDIVVSFKQNVRVITKASNTYQHFDENGKKVLVKQITGENIAVRKSMHKDTVFGVVNLKLKKMTTLANALKNPCMIVDVGLKRRVLAMQHSGFDQKQIKNELEADQAIGKNVEIYYFSNDTNDRYYATRKVLDTSFNEKTILGSVADTAIQKILLAHLRRCDNDSELAFSPDGIDRMNRNIVEFNDGVMHKPIFKVRKYEKADKFAIGQNGNKKTKYVEAAKGTNLFFAIYRKETIDPETNLPVFTRTYATIPLNVAIERIKRHLSPVPEVDESGNKLLFYLSPNDLVYVPTDFELNNGCVSEPIDKNRIYRFVDPDSNNGAFTPAYVAKVLFSFNKAEQNVMKISYPIQDELGLGSPRSKNNKAITGEVIRKICIPIKTNRLGHIINKVEII